MSLGSTALKPITRFFLFDGDHYRYISTVIEDDHLVQITIRIKGDFEPFHKDREG